MDKELEDSLVKKYNYMFDEKETFSFSCDDGWYDLIDIALLKIKKADTTKEFRILQIKEKYGMLCLYGNRENKKIQDIVSKAEDVSLKICEICGKDACLCVKGMWYKTLCQTCREKYGYKIAS